MKKLLLLFFLFLFVIFNLKESYSYGDCIKEIYPVEVSTNNLNDYLVNNKYNTILSFCSYDMCYEVKEGNYLRSIDNFKKIYNSQLNENDYNEVYVKGYPITKIIFNYCI